MERYPVPDPYPDDDVLEAPDVPRVIDLEALPDHRLRLHFTNGEVRLFDLTPYLDRGLFRPLQSVAVFDEAWVEAGAVEWPGHVGLSFDTLYLQSRPEAV